MLREWDLIFLIKITLSIITTFLSLLLVIAFYTLLERKLMASFQRRSGPNVAGFGVLQPFADALKLMTKQAIAPKNANKFFFYITPVISLSFSLLYWIIIPLSQGGALCNSELTLLIIFVLSSLSVYGVILSGWSSNSKYALLGAFRSTAQMISYEVVFSITVWPVVILTSSTNLLTISLLQSNAWFIVELLPFAVFFLIISLAETNRAPFDLPEAESELVAGYFTEYSSIGFSIFFISEYSSMSAISSFFIVLFLGGGVYLGLKHFRFTTVENETHFSIKPDYWSIYDNFDLNFFGSVLFGIKLIVLSFYFIWNRATLPRFRYDQLILLCWKYILTLIFSLILAFVSISTLVQIWNITDEDITNMSIKLRKISNYNMLTTTKPYVWEWEELYNNFNKTRQFILFAEEGETPPLTAEESKKKICYEGAESNCKICHRMCKELCNMSDEEIKRINDAEKARQREDQWKRFKTWVFVSAIWTGMVAINTYIAIKGL